MPVDWVFVAIAVLLLVHFVFVAAAIRYSDGHPTQRGHRTATDGAADAEVDSHPGDGMVTCLDCGEANEAEYRYCRQCVSELPTGVSLSTSASGGRSRRVF